MDTLTSMRVYVCVVKLKSFSLAAIELDISSSSVSKQVSQLEKHLGAKLLQRTTRRLFVTELGEVYYQKCLIILAQIDEAESLVSTLQSSTSGNLKVTCNMTFGQLQLSKAIPLFMQKYPDVTVDVTLDDRPPDLMRDGFDLAIRISEPQLPNSSLIAREISKLSLHVCATKNYLAKHGTPQQVTDLTKHNCLIFVHAANADTWTLKHSKEHITVKVDGDLRANNSLIIRASALKDRGIANLAGFVIEDYVKSGELVRVFPEHQPEQLSVFAVYPERKFTPRKVSLFIEFLQAWLNENHETDPWG
ncbi:MAG: DNA-binding transcriptional LysR family regulator [Oceanospirillaceae bacterium]|jgi:DNA-binding transcriptional LysR family regulator